MQDTYKLYDMYEGSECLYRGNSPAAVLEACIQRDYDTDCEWVPELYKNSVLLDDWHYTDTSIYIGRY